MQEKNLVELLNTIGDSQNPEINEFRKLVFDFDSEIVEFDKKQSELTNYIQAYKIPSAEKIAIHKHSIDSLSEKYHRIYSLAKTITESDDIHEDDGVEKFIKAIANCKRLTLQAKVKETCEILERFCRIVPLGKNPDILASYQQDAKAIMEQLSTAADSEIESLIEDEKVTRPKIFLKAFDCDIESEDYFELSELVRESFGPNDGPKIQFLLNSKKFEERESVVVENAVEEHIDTPVAIQAEAPVSIEEETPVEESTLIEENAPIETIAPAEEKPEESEYLDAIYPVKPLVVGASKFATDFSDFFNFKIIGQIIPAISRFDILTEHHLVKIGNYKENQHLNANDLEECGKKNLFAIYNYTEEDNTTTKVCCLTKYCRDGIQKETNYNKFASKYFRFSYSKGGYTGDSKISKKIVQKYLYKNNLLFNYFDAIRNHVEEKTFHDIINGVQRKSLSYEVPVVFDKQKINCFMLLNSDDAAECVYKNILIIADIIDIPTTYNDACENAYVVKDGAIYKCSPKNGSVADQYEEQYLEIATRPDPIEETKVEETTNIAEQSLTFVSKTVEIAEPLEADTNKETPPPPKVNSNIFLIDESNRNPLESPTAHQLIDLRLCPYESEFLFIIEDLLKKDSDENVVMQALLLAETASFEKNCEKCGFLSKQIQLATHLFFDKSLKYSGDVLSTILHGAGDASKEITLAIYLQGMVSPAFPNYAFKNQVTELFCNYEDELADFPEFKPLYNNLRRSLDVCAFGFTKNILHSIGTEEDHNRLFSIMRKKAKQSLVPNTSRLFTSHSPFSSQCLNNPDWEMNTYLKQIENGDKDQETLDYMTIFLEDFYDDNKEISIDKIDIYVENEWKKIYKDSIKIFSKKRKFSAFIYKKLEIIKEWIDCFGSKISQPENLEKLKSSRNLILQDIDNLLNNKTWKRSGQGNVLEYTLDYIKQYLTSTMPEDFILNQFSELLKTGFISLHEDGYPYLDRDLTEVRYNEPWRNTLRHIIAEKSNFDEVLKKITEPCEKNVYENTFHLFDNLHQKEMICALRKKDPWENDATRRDAFTAAEEYAKKAKEAFRRNIELAYTYGQCSDSEKETLLDVVEQYQEYFFEKGEFAQWRWFLKGLERQLAVFTKQIGDELKKELDSKLTSIKPDESLDKDDIRNFLLHAKKAYDEHNYALAEEYINRFDHNDEVSDYDDENENEKNYFDIFLGAKSGCRELGSICKSNSERNFNTFATEYLQEVCGFSLKIEDDIENRLGIIANWSGANSGLFREEKIKSLFCAIGFDVEKVEEKKTNGDYVYKRFVIKSNPVKKSMTSYKHPIANYGTGLGNINLICTDNNYMTAKDLVETIEGLSTANGLQQSNIIVFANKPLDLSYRRGVADYTHSASMHNNAFLLIDTTLIFFLATLRKRERIQALLQCTLPFSTYEPFSVGDSSVGTPDEMIFGRENELSQLMSEKSPCFVYGGRQLGKTSLLLRAENLCHKPEQKEIAVYININGCKSEESFVKAIINAVNGKLKIAKIKCINTCSKLEVLMKNISILFEEKNILSLFLLMDESDNYLEFIAETNYNSLDKFITLRRDTGNKFRFVFAGLRNVSRAKNATANNSTMGQFGQPLCIRPLKYRDATKLLVTPLRYLGFTIAKFPYLDTILANTNYYPGMIQYYGNILVRNSLINRYDYKSSKQNPPFTLERNQLSKVMATDDLRRSIQRKFMMSLEVDERYLLLAKSITALYYFHDSTNAIWMGFKIEDIKSMIDFLPILRLQQNEPIEDLLNEMVDMGILEHSDELYRLRRRTFIDMIGKSFEAIEKDVQEANKIYESTHGK